MSAEKPLTYGQSITDACIDFAASERCLDDLAQAVATAGPSRRVA